MEKRHEEMAPCLAALMPPAGNWPESGSQMTTEEVFNALQEHCPGDYERGDVYRALLEGGYKRDVLPGGAAVWLIR